MKIAIAEKGVLQGTTLFEGGTRNPKCHRFGSIPYALPPTGERRWRKPQPLPRSFVYSYGTEKSPAIFSRPSFPCAQLPNFGIKSSNEDCLKCNIWVPVGSPPRGGWPVLFWIRESPNPKYSNSGRLSLDGGFLQFGSNNSDDPSDLLRQTDVKCIIVSPGYRLGVFGFLASRDLSQNPSPETNFGFWDQRLALEWTYDNIANFGGDRENITVGGLSAGAYSAFHQLAHDINPSCKKQIIRRVLQFSNGCGVQPKLISEAQQQFETLLLALEIPRVWTSSRRMEALRGKTADELVSAVERMNQKFFRPVLDGAFISTDLFPSIYNGSFGRRMADLGIQIVIGDLTQEYHLYKKVYPPDSYEALVERLTWDYPRDIVLSACSQYEPSKSSTIKSENDWVSTFGYLYADLQIHSTMRGFIQSIAQTLPISHIHRYRIDWRTKSVDQRLPREVGATHATDMSIWFYGNGETLTPEEKSIVREWIHPLARFIKGEDVAWGTANVNQVRYLRADGGIEIRDDEWWTSKMHLWDLTFKATNSPPRHRESQL